MKRIRYCEYMMEIEHEIIMEKDMNGHLISENCIYEKGK